jgi:mannose-6-phosphate isomerase
VGAAVCGRFGDTLPFLIKVLAADEPLSLQAHPSAQQAVEGFGREERQGIPVSSPVRNYATAATSRNCWWRGSVQGTGRVPVRGAQCRAVARAEGFGPRPFVGLLHDQSEADGLRALFTT